MHVNRGLLMDEVQIAVLLSSYNGFPYISDQVDSVLNQILEDGISLHLFIRDDGSHDGTLDYLKNLQNDERVTVSFGENIGVAASFFSLLNDTPEFYDYLALCDQDDVWLEDKLMRAIGELNRSNVGEKEPLLYCSEYYFCDSDLGVVSKSKLNKTGVSFQKMLYENPCSGNTMVLNKKLHQILNQIGYEVCGWHDWWIALVASAFGNIIYDDYPSLYYRRTGDNASATGTSLAKVMAQRFKTFAKGDGLTFVKKQLRHLYSYKTEISSRERLSLLETSVGGNCWSKAFHSGRYRQSLPGEIAVRLLLLFQVL